jgi:hypothetical protein
MSGVGDKARSAAGAFLALLLMGVGLLDPRSRAWEEDLAADRRFERSLLWREALVIFTIAGLIAARTLLS